MIVTTVLAVAVPLFVLASVAMIRGKGPRLSIASHGVALQTVIVIVVLLAIAGAVAGVLLSRGGEAVAEAEQQDILVDAADITNQGLCESYGLTWTAGICYRTLPVQQAASTFTDQASCEDYTYLGDNPYTWNDSDPDNPVCE